MAHKTYSEENKQEILRAYDEYVAAHKEYGAANEICKQKDIKRGTLYRWLKERKDLPKQTGDASQSVGNSEMQPVVSKKKSATRKSSNSKTKLSSPAITSETVKCLENIKKIKAKLVELQQQLDAETKALIESIGE